MLNGVHVDVDVIFFQATRAASDAWKVMTLEEKSKYTKRAREVWDDYLSSAPAREPKPRKQVTPSF